MNKESESSIQSAICDYLALRKHLFWRANNVPVYMPDRQAFRAMPKHSLKGTPDIIVIQNGFIGIEVKAKNGKLSPEQKEFERRCVENGGEYLVARSIDDVINFGL
jgi:VRR-NUC domain